MTMSAMKILVDTGRCHGHALCRACCPELFDVDDDEGHVRLLTDDVPAELEPAVREAVSSCPERAIALVAAGGHSRDADQGEGRE